MNFALKMTSAVLSIRADGTYTPFSSDAWIYAGQMTLLGMGMVFAVLALLWMILAIFKLVFTGKEPKKEKVKAPEAIAKAVEEAVAVSEPVAVSTDDELVAVITAAVAAYMADECGGEVPAGAFRVVSFRRASGGRPWNVK